MNGDMFVDTNVLVYAIGNDPVRTPCARKLLLAERSALHLSTQVLGEFIHVCVRKGFLGKQDAVAVARDYMATIKCHAITERMVERAMELYVTHSFSYWDALIVAAALEANCAVLYTEDLQPGQIIDGKLLVTNPLQP